ncbi:MAG: TAT-variant-translocated molybdopterin oxidoreductase [Chitinophagaceae bacterium]|nr:TAT-variant-translocated molybdopterin oxidoreductase [Chitinophagaceae bacterium]
MSKKKYWQSFGELNSTKAYQDDAANEFREELPFEGADNGMSSNRRDFLKYLGFSTAAATLAASCEIPVKKSIPFLNKPADIVPGVSNYYATTFVLDGDVVPVLAKVRDGRPIKIEGNEMGFTKGGTSQRVQASVLSLYDTARVRYPMEKSGNEFKEAPTYEAVDKKIAAALAGAGGKEIAVLTSTINSPSVLAVIDEFKAKYPTVKHYTYDAVSYSGMIQANEVSYGKKGIPSYHFDNAKVIVSFGADFLGTWLSPVEFAKQYAAGRRIDEKNPSMSRHFQFESMYSMTGANADERFTHRPSELGAALLALYAKLGGAVTAPAIADKRLAAGIEAAAKELLAAGGNAVVVCGSNDVNAQILVNAINDKIGANGKTINFGTMLNYRKGVDADMEQLVVDMNAGKIAALLIYGANPVYTYADSKKFSEGLKKVGLTVSFSENEDETTQLCQYILPAPHFLESWGDAEAKTNHLSFIQPTIHPLFKTRAFATSLLKWSGSAVADYETYFKTYWSAKLGSSAAFDKALQDGVIEPATPEVAGAGFNGAALADAAAKLSAAKSNAKYELNIYQKVSIGDGKMANNPWLQEMPDPLTRATWDNYAVMSPATAKEFGYATTAELDEYEVNPPKRVVKITVKGKDPVELPVIIVPGTNNNTISVAVGYGRSEKVGLAAKGAGKNVYPFVSYNGSNYVYSGMEATVEKTNDMYNVSQMQTHSTYGDRVEVVKETSLKIFKENPKVIINERMHELKDYGGIEKFDAEGTLYPVYDKPGIKWGMSIDLNTCTGCGACVVACSAENNVSVVGKNQVGKYHDMHWLRIDRYFSGTDMDNPDVVFQPMLCQHCDNAPCENVCPVAATNHSSEGLNQMTYNRCIGTRYCANNCPYKVRRFNWHDWNGADSFKDNQNPIIETGRLNEVTTQMNDDLTRMVLNPDVTVRSRGVIEKCSFCVQRLQEAKLNAKKESRPMVDTDIKTACQQACPTNAIAFGNVNDKESAINKIRTKENVNRNYYVLEQLHVLPNVGYMAKVRNTDRHVGNEAEGSEAHGEEKHEEKKEEKKAEAAH